MSLGLFATLKSAFGEAKYTLARKGRVKHWIVIALLSASAPFGTMLIGGNFMKTFRNEEAVLGSGIGDVEKSFIRGLLSVIIGILYLLAAIIICALFAIAGLLPVAIVAGIVLFIAISLFLYPALINFVREDKFSAAFNLGKIVKMITEVGWIRYILAIILITIVLALAGLVIGICVAILTAIFGLIAIIPILGWIIAALGVIAVAIVFGMMASFLMLVECSYFSKLFSTESTSLELKTT